MKEEMEIERKRKGDESEKEMGNWEETREELKRQLGRKGDSKSVSSLL